MIHQFSELGRYFLERDSVTNRLEQLAQDPGAIFGPNVLLLVFGKEGFESVQPGSYDDAHRLRYLCRRGPPNTWDATPTAGMPQPKSGKGPEVFLADLNTRLARLGSSIRDALNQGKNLDANEAKQLEALSKALPAKSKTDDVAGAAMRAPIIAALQAAHPDPKQRAFLSLAWVSSSGSLNYVGDFEAFRQQVLRIGGDTKDEGESDSARGQCCICGASAVSVSGEVQVPNFKFYTLDKPGSVSGGFDRSRAWRNFPVCGVCRTQLDFSGERVKDKLSFKYYGFRYLLLPSPVQPAETQVFELLRKLIDAKVDNTRSHLFSAVEDELLAVIAEEENNRLQVDLLFYVPLSLTVQTFRPTLYISGLLPTRFRELFNAKDRVNGHAWLQRPGHKAFVEGSFTFGSIREIFPAKSGGSTFDDDFLAATRAALEKRRFDSARLLSVGMRLVQQDYIGGKGWLFRLADLFRSLLFFELLSPPSSMNSHQTMHIPDYGISQQAKRVSEFFQNAPNKLSVAPDAQAAFLLGACCGRIEYIQSLAKQGATPFADKYKGFRLNQIDIERLFFDAKEKSRVYGREKETIVRDLLICAGAALAACPDYWQLSPDEVSYFFALGHALRSRLAVTKEEAEPEESKSEA